MLFVLKKFESYPAPLLDSFRTFKRNTIENIRLNQLINIPDSIINSI